MTTIDAWLTENPLGAPPGFAARLTALARATPETLAVQPRWPLSHGSGLRSARRVLRQSLAVVRIRIRRGFVARRCAVDPPRSMLTERFVDADFPHPHGRPASAQIRGSQPCSPWRCLASASDLSPATCNRALWLFLGFVLFGTFSRRDDCRALCAAVLTMAADAGISVRLTHSA